MVCVGVMAFTSETETCQGGDMSPGACTYLLAFLHFTFSIFFYSFGNLVSPKSGQCCYILALGGSR